MKETGTQIIGISGLADMSSPLALWFEMIPLLCTSYISVFTGLALKRSVLIAFFEATELKGENTMAHQPKIHNNVKRLSLIMTI